MRTTHESRSRLPRFRAFTLIELMFSIALAMVIVMMTAPSFNAMSKGYRLRADVTEVDTLIQKTMSMSLSSGQVGSIIFGENTVQGLVSDSNGNAIFDRTYQLKYAEFGRKNVVPTPWLQVSDTVAGSYVNDLFTVRTVLDITSTGVMDNSSVVFFNYKGTDVVIELLIGGTVKVFHQDLGAEKWTR